MRSKKLLVLLVMAVFMVAIYSVGGVAGAAGSDLPAPPVAADASDDTPGAGEAQDRDDENEDEDTDEDSDQDENEDINEDEAEEQDEVVEEDQEADEETDEDFDLDEEKDEDTEKKAEKVQKAQEDLAQALTKLAQDPDDKDTYKDLAKAYAALGQWDQAKQAATQLLAVDPGNEDAGILLAVSLYRQGDPEGAMQQLQAMAAQKSEDDDVYELQGELLELQGELDKALEKYERAAVLNPNDPNIFTKLSKAYQKLEIEGIKVFVNGSKPQFDVQPQVVNGRTLIPFRSLAESLGAQVTWDGATRQVTVVKADITIQLTLDSTVAMVNGTPVNLDVPATITGGRVLVPLRLLGEGLGAKVKWDQQSQMVIVSK